MTHQIEQIKTLNQAEIAGVPYELWEKSGHPANRNLQFWLEAETQLREAAEAITAPSAAPVSSNTAGKAANVQLGPPQASSSKPQQKVPRF